MPICFGPLARLERASSRSSKASCGSLPHILTGVWLSLGISLICQRHEITNYRRNPFFPINTLTLMRGAVAAQRLGVFASYVDEMYRRMWSEPRKMDDPKLWRAALLEAGFDAPRFEEMVQDPEIKERLLANTQRSVERGTFGSPTVFVGDEIFSGKDRLHDVEELLAVKD